MANKFSFTITAVDKASAIVKKINKATGEITRPVADIGKSVAAMGREVKRNPIVQFTQQIGRSALGAAESVGKLLSPFGGAALGGAASVSGLAALAEAWGKSGIAIDNASKRTGIAVGKLQAYRGAATAAGVAADDMQSALVGLGSTLQDAQFGRNPEALVLLNKMGVQIRRNKDGVVDTIQAIEDISDYIHDQNLNPQSASMLLSHLNIPDNLLPMMMKGSAAIKKYVEQAEKAGAANDQAAESGKRLGDSWNNLKLQWEGLENKLSSSALGDAAYAVTEGWAAILSGGRYRPKDFKKSRATPVDSDEGRRIRSAHEAILNGARSGIPTTTAIGAAQRTSSGKIGGLPSGIPSAPGQPGQPGEPGKSAPVTTLFAKLEQQYSLPAGALDRVWAIESGRGRNMESKAGATGHFQFMPDTAARFGMSRADTYDLTKSATAAAQYLSQLRQRYGGNMQMALAGYNWGEGNLDRYGLSRAPAETREYLRKYAAMEGSQQPTLAAQTTPSDQAQKMTDAGRPLLSAQANQAQRQSSPAATTQSEPQKVIVDVNVTGNTQGVKVAARTDSPHNPPPRVSFAMPAGPTA